MYTYIRMTMCVCICACCHQNKFCIVHPGIYFQNFQLLITLIAIDISIEILPHFYFTFVSILSNFHHDNHHKNAVNNHFKNLLLSFLLHTSKILVIYNCFSAEA